MKKIVMVITLCLFASVYVRAQEAADSGKREEFNKRMEKIVDEIDVNKDGKFDLTEFLAHAEERFNRIDANSDGYITREEGKAAHKAMREKHHRWAKERKEKLESKE